MYILLYHNTFSEITYDAVLAYQVFSHEIETQNTDIKEMPFSHAII